MSVSEPEPFTAMPSRARRTLTSPCASVPPVMLCTEYSCSCAPEFTIASMALKVASTEPSPSAVALRSSPSTTSDTVACGVSPISAHAFMPTSLMRSLAWLRSMSVTSAIRSSSKISRFLSASSLKRRKASAISSWLANSKPSAVMRCLKALRPDSLPSVRRLSCQPTSWARMIS